MPASSRPAFTIRSKASTTELCLRREASLLRTPERKAATPPQRDPQGSHRWPTRRASSCAYSQPRLEQPRWIDHVPMSPCRLVTQPLMQTDTGCLDAWGYETAPDAWGVSPSRMPLGPAVTRPSSASTLASAAPPTSALAPTSPPASTLVWSGAIGVGANLEAAPTPLPTALLQERAPPTDSASTGHVFESLEGFPGFRSLPGYPAPAPQPATTPPSATFLAFTPRSIGEEIVRRRPVYVLYTTQP